MKICELKQKEVINICTCRSLGCPIDAEFDCKSSQLTALILPGPGRFCCLFGRDNEYIIPWECICQIGADIILVEIEEEKCRKLDEKIRICQKARKEVAVAVEKEKQEKHHFFRKKKSDA